MAFIFDENKLHSYYAKYLFDSLRLSNLAQVGALPSFNGSEIESLHIQLPKIDEQQKIGNFFKTIDDLIEKKNEKLKAYQQMKKALLQKMFV